MKRFALKRLTALALALVMTLSLLPMNVWATELQVDTEEQVVVAAEETEEASAEIAEEPAEDSSAVVEESAEEPVVEEEETESGETEEVSASAGVSVPLANSAASAYEARWGLATGTDNTGKPTSWMSGTLAEAMTYANGLESGTVYIQLLSDVKTTAALKFSKTTILDLNGFDIDRGVTEATSNGSVIYVWGNLTLCDTSATDVTKQGKITGGNTTSNGGGVYVCSGSSFTMNGGNITGNTASSGGGVYVYGGTFTMNGGSISGNAASGSGGGVCVSDSGTFTMNGGNITGNAASSTGGGVRVGSGTFTMNGGNITGNTATYGGGVYVGSGTFTMNGGSITGNTASDGGGVYVYGSTFTMNGGNITGNTASYNGGGVCVNGSSAMQISGSPVISGNVSNGTLNTDTGLYELGEHGSSNNVYLPDGVTISVDTLYSGTSIGVTLAFGGGRFTSGGAKYIDACYFSSDNKDYFITTDDKENLKLDSFVPQAQWGLATGTDNTGKPTSWTSGTLAEAMTYANGLESGVAYIQLLGDVERIPAFDSGTTTILDLNGYDIDSKSGVAVYGSLTLCDTSTTDVTKQGKITGSSDQGVYVNGGTFTMDGGSITGNTADCGGGVFVYSGTFTMNGGNITGNTASSVVGGGVYVNGGTFTMNGGSITGNTASDGGGGVCAYGTFTMNGGSITGNTATYGGGVYVGSGTFTMNGGNITGNIAEDYDGGGVFVDDGTFTMNGGNITGNTASSGGGGVYVDSNGTMIVSGTPVISNNKKEAGASVTENNVYLPSGKTITINGLRNPALIGITMDENSGVFAQPDGENITDTSDYIGNFSSDSPAFLVGVDSKGLTLSTEATIVFKANDGSGTIDTQTVPAGITTALKANPFTRENCLFNGWNTAADGTGTAYTDKATIMLQSSIILYAQWSIDARWGLATGANNDKIPASWTNGTLTEAMSYANSLASGTAYIQLLNDVKTNTYGALVFESDTSTILDLNGHDIDRGLTKATDYGSVIRVYGGLTLCDTSSDDVMKHGHISGGRTKDNGGGVFVSGSFTMNGGTISSNTAYNGGGVYIFENSNARGTFIMNGGSITSNTASNRGGGVYDGYIFTMNGGTISDNTATSSGGGVFVNYQDAFSMNSGTISGNAASSGGGVCAGGALTMNGGSITNNTASSRGGGVYVSRNSSMKGGTISGNTAYSGGGVFVETMETFSMSGGSITSNTASDRGGGVSVEGRFNVSGKPVISNNKRGEGTAKINDNIYLRFPYDLYDDYTIITVVGTLQDGASIGVTPESTPTNTAPITVAQGGGSPAYTITESDAAKFVGDDGSIGILDSANNAVKMLKLVAPSAKLGVTSSNFNLLHDSALSIPVECNYEILDVFFENEALAELFDITMSEDGGEMQIVLIGEPEDMTWAEWGKLMAGSYKSAIRIEYFSGKYYTIPQQLTITLTATSPKVTAGAVKFNSFLDGDTQPLALAVGDAVVESVAVDGDKENPTWITVNDDQTLTLINEELVNKKGSGKLNLLVTLEGWRAPAEVVVSVSAAYSAPKLKLKTSSVNLVSKAEYQEPVELSLLSGDKNFDIGKVTALSVDNAAYVVAYLGGGLFTLDTAADIAAGKINLIAEIDGKPNQTVTVPLTVKVVMPTLKANPAKVTLNTAKGYDEGTRDEMTVTFSGDVPAFWYNDVTWEITPPKNATADMLTVENNGDGTLTIYANEGIVDGSYKMNVTVGAAKPVAITVTAKATLPKLKLNKSSITLNTAMGDYADMQTVTVTDSDVNYDFVLLQEEITAPDGISAVVGENNVISVSTAATTAPGSYKVEIDHKMPGGQPVKSSLTVKVVEKLPTLKPDNKSLSLDRTHGIATVNVDGLAGFTVGELVAEPTVEGITVEMIDRDSFVVTADETLDKKGGKINVYYKLSDAVQTKPVAITVKPVTAIAVTAAVKGNMDVTRPAFDAPDAKLTANFTFKYTGWYPGEYGDAAYEPTLVWEVYAMSGKNKIVGHEAYDFVTGKGSLVASSDDNNGGWFCDVDDTDYGVALALNTDENSAWKNGAVNPKYTYTVETKLVFADGTEAVCKPVKLTVKQGSVKFAADTKAVTVAKQQDAESVTFAINGTDKDKLLVADIAKVEVAASKNPSAFTVVESGDGYAIKVIDPTTAKSGTVKLNIWLEGTYVDGCEDISDTKSPDYRKPNATVSLKVTVQ